MRILLMAAMLAAPIPAMAAPGADAAAARAFLQSIYAYYHKGGTGAPMQHPERWIEPRLAAAMQKDAAAAGRRGDIGKLDGDPFCDCQDFETIRPALGPVAINGDRATVDVAFTNGERVTMRYTLVWTAAGWRVFDIRWHEGALREMFLPKG